MLKTAKCSVSILGQDEECTVKYAPSPEGVPWAKPKGTPEGEVVYWIVYRVES